ncbi:MAG: hypothetical protein K0U47_11660 [Epsilonproteobacteria bacterium]|nr:hypothetical protein [Campylobacterota bacterium]
MRKIGLSLAVIAMITTAAQAEMKLAEFGGSASLFYGTNDAFGDGDLFDKTTSYGNAAINLNGSANVGSCDTCTTLNFGVTGVSTMGLENTVVGGTWVNHTLDDAIWIDTLNLTFNPLDGISNTTMVIGRQTLETPMVFTETWNIAQNTFDAAVAVNNDIKDTTLVGAWVGRSNNAGSGTYVTVNATDGFSNNSFDSFLTDEGAYTVGGVTKLIPMLDTQAWYYVAPSVASVAWVQADAEISGVTLGAQYAMLDGKDDSDGNVVAVKLGYTYEGLGLSAAYSSVDEMTGTSSALGFKNLGNDQSMLYTEAWWNFGHVGESDTDSFNVTATYSLEDIADLGLFYTSADHATVADMNEITVTAGKSFGNLDVSLAYINTDIDDGTDAQTDIQAYFVYNF